MDTTYEIERSRAPDGTEMVLYKCGKDYIIRADGKILIAGSNITSEIKLAELTCSHIHNKQAPKILICGLGLGHTLQTTLENVPLDARIIVSEIVPAIIRWNREILGISDKKPMNDPRVSVIQGDVFTLLKTSKEKYDAVILDVDNGPGALSLEQNSRLYEDTGLEIIKKVLNKGGALTIWSSEKEEWFEERLKEKGFSIDIHEIPIDSLNRRLYWIYLATPLW